MSDGRFQGSAIASPTARPPVKKRRRLLFSMFSFLLFLALATAAVCWYATTPAFANRVRRELIATLEKATGGRVELASFHWSLRHLEFEADDLTIHGLESPTEVPYAHLDRLFVRAKIISLFRARVGLNLLQATHPVIHLIVYPDGSTNQPSPKAKGPSRPVTNTIFDLAVDRTELDHGLLILNQRAIPFELAASDLGATVTYDAVRDHYLASVTANDIVTRRAKLAAVHSKLTLKADLARTSAVLSQFQLQTGDSPSKGSLLAASGAIANYANPIVQLKVDGSVDVRELESLTAIPGIRAGIAELHLQARGNLHSFFIDGNARVSGAAYRLPQVRLSGASASTNIHITQDELSLTSLKGRLGEGGSLDGELHLYDWLAPSSVSPTRKDAVATVAKKAENLPAPAMVERAVIRARVRDVTLRSVLRIVAPEQFQDLGFETSAAGPVSVEWTGSADDLKVSANVTLAPGSSENGVPLSGAVDASYDNRRGIVDIRHLEAQTPGSHTQIQGALGVYPINRPSAIQVDFTTTNLGEFDKTLAALGVSSTGPGGKTSGVQAIPVQLHGRAEFHGTVSGGLLRPDVKGHLTAANFDTVFEVPANATVPLIASTAPAAKAVRSASTAAAGEGANPPAVKLTGIHWDSLDANAEYSPQTISIAKATLLRGKTSVQITGQLNAHHDGRHHDSFDDQSGINANVTVTNASLADLLTIAGSDAPITGTLNLQATAGGTLGNLSGGGHLAVQSGQIYNQPYRSLNTDLRFSGQEIDLANLKFLQDGGLIAGNGGYDFHARTVHFQATGSGFDLAHIPQLQNPKAAISGQLGFKANASGPINDLTAQADLQIGNLAIDRQLQGSLHGNAALSHNRLTYRIDSEIDRAQLELAGQTTLTGDYQTEAHLTATQLHVERFLQLFNVSDVTSNSVLNLRATVSGPAKLPRLLTGRLTLSSFSGSIGGIQLASGGDLNAQMEKGVLHLDPIHIKGDDTDLQAQGSVFLFEEPRALDLHANGSINLKLAQSFDPNITSSGHVEFNVDASGTMRQPSLAGQVKFTNVALALGDLPNGLSQMNGTLIFDQDRLTVQQLSAVTGGGKLQIGGSITYQQGIYGDLTATGKDIRIRYPQGVSSMADATLRLQGTETSLLLSGNILVTRFSISPNLDIASLKSSAGAVGPPPDANSPSNHVRLDIHVTSAPELNFQNSFAKLAGDVDVHIRGTVANPALLGQIGITDGSATFAGTTYQLQRGEIYFSNPIHIDPVIDLDATARVEDYDIDIGVHGTLSNLGLTYRSEPPLPEADVFALLALGRTQEEQQIYSQEQQSAGVNSTADALLGGALNATVSSRVSKLFGAGSVKIDPTFVGNLGNSTARITVQEKIGKNATVTYATNVNSTAEQLIQGQLYLTPNISLVAQRDESGVFSLILKIHQRHR